MQWRCQWQGQRTERRNGLNDRHTSKGLHCGKPQSNPHAVQSTMSRFNGGVAMGECVVGHLDNRINIVCNPPEEENNQALVLAIGGYVGRGR